MRSYMYKCIGIVPTTSHGTPWFWPPRHTFWDLVFRKVTASRNTSHCGDRLSVIWIQPQTLARNSIERENKVLIESEGSVWIPQLAPRPQSIMKGTHFVRFSESIRRVEARMYSIAKQLPKCQSDLLLGFRQKYSYSGVLRSGLLCEFQILSQPKIKI